MRLPRLLSAIPTIVTAAVLVAGCSSASNPSPAAGSPATPPVTSARPAASAAPVDVVPGALLAVGRAGESDLEVIEAPVGQPVLEMPVGVPDASWRHIFNVRPEGSKTRLQNLVFGEDTGRELVLDGRWLLPTVGLEAVPAGRSLDDSTIVLVGERTDDSISRFAVVRAAIPPADAPLTLVRTVELNGSFEYDAISPDGSILYLVEHLTNATGAYQVRSAPVATARLDDLVITDKRNIGESMAGAPVTQLRRDDGMVMTLYVGADHPFVHALNTKEKWAVCIDLPANGPSDRDAGDDWGLTQAPDGRAIYAANASLGLVVEIEPSELIARRTARLPEAAAAAPRIVLAKFGHEDAGPLGRRAVVSQSGDSIIAGGRDGLVAVRSKDLSVAWRGLVGEAVRSIALTADGATAFALLGSGRIVAVSTSDGTTLGTVPGGGYDRLLAITG